jgi:hypothetical protein
MFFPRCFSSDEHEKFYVILYRVSNKEEEVKVWSFEEEVEGTSLPHRGRVCVGVREGLCVCVCVCARARVFTCMFRSVWPEH